MARIASRGPSSKPLTKSQISMKSAQSSVGKPGSVACSAKSHEKIRIKVIEDTVRGRWSTHARELMHPRGTDAHACGQWPESDTNRLPVLRNAREYQDHVIEMKTQRRKHWHGSLSEQKFPKNHGLWTRRWRYVASYGKMLSFITISFKINRWLLIRTIQEISLKLQREWMWQIQTSSFDWL
jgi:hypothetical protein